MYNQSEFSKLKNYLLEKNTKSTDCKQILDNYVFTSKCELERHSFKKISLFLINTFNVKILEIISKIFFILCILIALVTTFSFLENETSDWYYILGMVLSLIPLILSLYIENVLEHYQDTFCKKCGGELACEEISEPVMKETSSFGDYTLTITRHWRCKHCGNVDARKGPENIFTEKGEMLPEIYLKCMECKECGGIGTVVEFKKPDVKEIRNKRITRRYYKCTLCDHEEINESEEIITWSTHAR